MNKILIRKATNGDINYLAKLLYELFKLEKDFIADIDKQIKGIVNAD